MTQNTQVDLLEAKGLIRLASIRPELEYLFRHGLVQDAAYASLLKQERRELHGRVGAALEELYPERAGELALVLACISSRPAIPSGRSTTTRRAPSTRSASTRSRRPSRPSIGRPA